MNVTFGIKKMIKKIPFFISTILQLHSKAPTTEIKRNWELLAICGTFLVFMNVLTGTPFIFGIKIIFPFSTFINDIGVWLLFLFVLLMCIFGIDIKHTQNVSK